LKTIQLGSLRDATLVERLAVKFAPLSELEKSGWLVGSGYQLKGGDTRVAAFLNAVPKAESRHIMPLVVDAYSRPESATEFHRTRALELYRAPHILVARTIDPQGRLHAAYSDRDASFTTTVVGIAAPNERAERIMALAALLNSAIVRYVLFLTAANVGAERPTVDPQDLRRLPIAMPLARSRDEQQLVAIVRSAQDGGVDSELLGRLDDLAAGLYRLKKSERAMVRDFLRFGVDAHFRPLDAMAFERPSPKELERYRAALQNQLARAFGVPTEAQIFDDGSSYISVSVRLGADSDDGALDRALVDGAHIGTQEGEAVVLRRTFRVYRRHGVDVAKPAEARQWTETAAARDADEIIAEALDARVGSTTAA
jgi:hypothetical protein